MRIYLSCECLLTLNAALLCMTPSSGSSFSADTPVQALSDFDKNTEIVKYEGRHNFAVSHRRHKFHHFKDLSSSSLIDSSPFLGSLKEPNKMSSKTPVYILVLLPKSTNYLFSIERVSPAIALATDNVTSSQFLARHRLVTLYADSMCHIAEAMNEAITFYIKGKVHAFFGPVCDYSMAPVARQAKYWNLPVITSGAMARDFSASKKTLYSTLTRVGSSFNTLIEFLVTLFREYNYSKVNLVYEPNGQGHILDKLCHVMTDGIHNAFT
ncbi:unnamed protein product, partial [Candidula unifasciata]